MASKNESYWMHLALYREIGGQLPQTSQKFKDFKQAILGITERNQTDHVESAEDLLKIWEDRGGISLGKYDDLLKLLRETNLKKIYYMVEKWSKQINDQLRIENYIPFSSAERAPSPPNLDPDPFKDDPFKDDPLKDDSPINPAPKLLGKRKRSESPPQHKYLTSHKKAPSQLPNLPSPQTPSSSASLDNSFLTLEPREYVSQMTRIPSTTISASKQCTNEHLGKLPYLPSPQIPSSSASLYSSFSTPEPQMTRSPSTILSAPEQYINKLRGKRKRSESPRSPSTNLSDHTRAIQCELRDWYIKTLSRLHPIPWSQWFEQDLDHIYTNLTMMGIKEQFHPRSKSDYGDFQTISRLFNSDSSQRTVCLIEGPAGIGKSTLCRRIAYLWSKNNYCIEGHSFDLAFILEAKLLTGNLKKCLNDQLFPKDFELSKDNIYECLRNRQKKSLLIIDGIDELTSEGKTVVMELLKGDKLRNINLLLTGRPEGSREFVKYVDSHFTLQGFSVQNITEYICKHFSSHHNSNVKDKLLNRLEWDTRLKTIMTSPFTTLLICTLMEDNRGDIPVNLNDTIDEVLQACCRNYVHKNEASGITLLSQEQLLSAAGYLAYKGIIQGMTAYPEETVASFCPDGVSEHLLKSGILCKDFTASRLHPKGFCYFPNKSFQEFLCAKHLAVLDVKELTEKLSELLRERTYYLKDINTLRFLLGMFQCQGEKNGVFLESICHEIDQIWSLMTKVDEKSFDEKGLSPTDLKEVIRRRYTDTVELLLEAGSYIGLKDDMGYTALRCSALLNQPKIMEMFLRLNSSINAKDKNGVSVLHQAVSKENLKFVQVLLEHNFGTNVQDTDGNTALHYAIGKENEEIIEALVNHQGVDFTLKNKKGFNVLHHAVSNGNNIATEKILDGCPQLADIKDDEGNAPLHLSCLYGYKNVTCTLITLGQADTDILNNQGQTPLCLAQNNGHTSLIEPLTSKDMLGGHWDRGGCFHSHGGALTKLGSSVQLIIPEYAVSPSNVAHISGQVHVFTDLKRFNDKFKLSKEERFVSPIVEFVEHNKIQFSRHMIVQIPAAYINLADGIVRVVRKSKDGQIKEIPLLNTSEEKQPDVYYEVSDDQTHIRVFTKHFTSYCVLCEYKTVLKGSLYGSRIQKSGFRSEVRISLYLWDIMLEIQDFQLETLLGKQAKSNDLVLWEEDFIRLESHDQCDTICSHIEMFDGGENDWKEETSPGGSSLYEHENRDQILCEIFTSKLPVLVGKWMFTSTNEPTHFRCCVRVMHTCNGKKNPRGTFISKCPDEHTQEQTESVSAGSSAGTEGPAHCSQYRSEKKSERMQKILFRQIGEELHGDSPDFKSFVYFIDLTPRDKCENDSSVEKLLETWAIRGGIGLGSYENLIQLLIDARLVKIHEMAKPQIEEIKKQLKVEEHEADSSADRDQ